MTYKEWSTNSLRDLSFFIRPTLLQLGIILALSIVGLAQPRRPMAPPDILRVATVSDAQISPNGSWVVYTVSTFEEDKTLSTLWIARAGPDSVFNPPTATPTPGRRPIPNVDWPDVRSVPMPLLPGGWNASNPRWSPDSNTIAFLANHEELEGLWTTNLQRREPRFITGVQSTNFFITYAGESFSWAPDSKRIAYIAAT